VSEVFLGVIAASVVVMALVQLGMVVVAARAARRFERLASLLENDIRPVVASLQALTADAARATALATAQVERADRLFGDVAARVEQTLAAVQDTLIAPAREGFAWLSGLKAVLSALLDTKRPPQPKRGGVEDDEALFIG